MRTLLAALTALMLFTTPVVAGDWGDFTGKLHPWQSAFKAKIAEKTLSLLKPRAEEGNTEAQYQLGLAYSTRDVTPGPDYPVEYDWIPDDNVKAAYWYRKAAEQGNQQVWSQVLCADNRRCAAGFVDLKLGSILAAAVLSQQEWVT